MDPMIVARQLAIQIDHVQILAYSYTAICTVFTIILSVLFSLNKTQAKFLALQTGNLSRQIDENKDDQEKQIKEHREDIKRIFEKLDNISDIVPRLEEKVLSIKENCTSVCDKNNGKWSGSERRQLPRINY